MSFAELWDSLLPLGRDPATGGYRRFSFTAADAACREWFSDHALERALRLQTDRSGNLWAWWDPPSGTESRWLPVTTAPPPGRSHQAQRLPLRSDWRRIERSEDWSENHLRQSRSAFVNASLR